MPPLLNGLNMQPQAPPLQIASPFNDVQMVALLAVWCPGTDAKCKVHKAQDILAEAVREKGRMEGLIRKIRSGDEE